jgi:hypothetical protein
MATPGVFDTILTQGIRAGQVPARTAAAREWYREAAKHWGHTIRQNGPRAGRKDFARMSEKKLIKENQDRLTSTIKPGNMYMYMYDPKFKDTLPFYDRFPLVFPFRVKGDRFWGINLHYLNLRQRAVLMDALYSITNNKKYDESTKLKISYEVLQAAARGKHYEPCVKQYLISHLKSQFMYIYPSEWDVATFLPVEKFAKKSKSQVWAITSKL